MPDVVKRRVVDLEQQKSFFSRNYDSFALLECGHRVLIGRRRKLRIRDLPQTLTCIGCGDAPEVGR